MFGNVYRNNNDSSRAYEWGMTTSGSIVFGHDVSYDSETDTYTLQDTETLDIGWDAMWELEDLADQLIGTKHYTCKSASLQALRAFFKRFSCKKHVPAGFQWSDHWK
jgi:hypothetical protein